MSTNKPFGQRHTREIQVPAHCLVDIYNPNATAISSKMVIRTKETQAPGDDNDDEMYPRIEPYQSFHLPAHVVHRIILLDTIQYNSSLMPLEITVTPVVVAPAEEDEHEEEEEPEPEPEPECLESPEQQECTEPIAKDKPNACGLTRRTRDGIVTSIDLGCSSSSSPQILDRLATETAMIPENQDHQVCTAHPSLARRACWMGLGILLVHSINSCSLLFSRSCSLYSLVKIGYSDRDWAWQEWPCIRT